MAPKGGRGGGSKSHKDNKSDVVEDVVDAATSGATSVHQEMSKVLILMVVMPILWYFLEEGRMDEVMRWAVGKIVRTLGNGGNQEGKRQMVGKAADEIVEAKEEREEEGERNAASGEAVIYTKGYITESKEGKEVGEQGVS
ncbi:MAG: hypothetical protein Q9213_004335 [Squamulea squamosa]